MGLEVSLDPGVNKVGTWWDREGRQLYIGCCGYMVGQRRKAVVHRLLWVHGRTEKEGCCT